MRADATFYRRERARLLSALTRAFGVENLALAEDVVQDTLAKAFEVWMYGGVPEHYSALLMTSAKNRALDVFRRQRTVRKFEPAIQRQLESEWTLRPAVEALFLPRALADDELRVMFSCCEPALAEEVQVALIVNMLCGFGASEIARVYLASEAAIAKRIARGKTTLAGSTRLFELTAADFAPRLTAVHRALYLLFSEGYHSACDDAVVRVESCHEALRLVTLLIDHAPAATPATFALAALMYLGAARLPARINELGELTALAAQDRSLWDGQLIASGLALLERAATGTEVSEFHVEAAIAGLHASAPSIAATRWDEIVRLYDLQMKLRPSPVVALNRAIAIAERDGPVEGLQAIAEISDADRLRTYPFYAAARGELELRRGDARAARSELERALALARNEAERRFLTRRIADCDVAMPSSATPSAGR
jgi:predicted RNA polymerase sigma factor